MFRRIGLFQSFAIIAIVLSCSTGHAQSLNILMVPDHEGILIVPDNESDCIAHKPVEDGFTCGGGTSVHIFDFNAHKELLCTLGQADVKLEPGGRVRSVTWDGPLCFRADSGANLDVKSGAAFVETLLLPSARRTPDNRYYVLWTYDRNTQQVRACVFRGRVVDGSSYAACKDERK